MAKSIPCYDFVYSFGKEWEDDIRFKFSVSVCEKTHFINYQDQDKAKLKGIFHAVLLSFSGAQIGRPIEDPTFSYEP